MSQRAERLKDDLIQKLIEYTEQKLEKSKALDLAIFISRFYANVAAEDMLSRDLEDLFGGALSLWSFGQHREQGEARIRLINPRAEKDGWHSPHSVIEIVNDDMPFLVDSVTAALNRRDIMVYLVIHPILSVTRDQKLRTGLAQKGEGLTESYMQLFISEQPDANAEEITAHIGEILKDVRAAVEDWPLMLGRLKETIESLDLGAWPLSAEELSDGKAFLAWLGDNHFTFLGYRDYVLQGSGAEANFSIRNGSGLGLLRDPEISVFDGLRHFGKLPAGVQNFLKQHHLLMVNKSSLRSTVHRPAHMDSIGIRYFDEKGNMTAERVFVGLLTSTAYSRSPRTIPMLARKVENCIARAGFASNSHDGKALQHILETYPRDELLQISEDELFDIAMGILRLQERQRIALFIRKDPLERYLSAFVYVPRERYDRNLRLRMQDILANAFNGRLAAYYTHMGDEPLGRIHFIIATDQGSIPDVDIQELERTLVEAGRSWADQLRECLMSSKSEEQTITAMRRYGDAFPVAYRERFDAQAAVFDLTRIEGALKGSGFGLHLYRPVTAEDNELFLKIYSTGKQLILSDILPSLENMGLRIAGETAYELKLGGDGQRAWVHDFQMLYPGAAGLPLSHISDTFHDAFRHIWFGEAEDDGFNKLVLAAGFGWRSVTVFRAYCKYLRQAGIPFSQSYMEDTLCGNIPVAHLLMEMFQARFDPAYAKDRSLAIAQLRERLGEALEKVSNADEDRILRRYWNIIESTLRTNFYQTGPDGKTKPYMAFKIDSHHVEELPLPRPMLEVFVFSPRVEAIHLRGGKVARGGIRWSDRREDFRTEILGLMKAQMVKNSVIVPVGSKGGFVVKHPPKDGGRDALIAEGIECYKTMMRGLLDITDNLVAGEVMPPKEVIRWDDDDPYLVVAADKGTATFSDIANAISLEYDFWLGDAFASGGSAGYDHKKMAITARGAWEAIKRHFRELGKDIQAEDFTCVGVGDMSGDVFGNGMLLSKHTRLLAAFNHQHIFLDPNPDAARSWQERRRLFDLPRSSWADYDQQVISKGGGVFDRKDKSILLSPEVQACLNIKESKLTPAALIQAILRTEVELLYFGGIGTYVKSAAETHADVGDRTNDALRVNAEDLRCKVIGEGANLAVTQNARIAYALKGGRINTDALDNSAGVDTSDHEVNIKILLNAVVTEGDLTLKQRNKLLAAMTDEVAALVLRDNYLQSQAISISQSQDWRDLDRQNRLMRSLEREGRLDRNLEGLPGEEAVRARIAAKVGLTRPELCVLLAYAKIALYSELQASSIDEEPQLLEDLVDYFPIPLQEKFRTQILGHRLRREIVATAVTNSLVNRMGPTFVHIMHERTGADAVTIARAYAVTRGAFDLRSLWADIESLDNQVSAATQILLMNKINDLAQEVTPWFIQHCQGAMEIAANIDRFRPAVDALRANLEKILPGRDRQRLKSGVKALAANHVPLELAQRIENLAPLVAALDIARIADGQDVPLVKVAEIYFAAGERFHLNWLREAAQDISKDSRWNRMAVAAITGDLTRQQNDLTLSILSVTGDSMKTRLDQWVRQRQAGLARADALVAELKQEGRIDLAKLAVASRSLRDLTLTGSSF